MRWISRSEGVALAREEGLAWLFVAKVLLAALLALWLGMRLALAQPATAMLTVFIVARPQSGLVLAKSFYRTIGTLAGAMFILGLYALVPQQRQLFLPGLALWVATCTFGASRYRNFAAYAFVLAGYTACIIGLPEVDAPRGIFDAAVARVSEVMLGILCAGVISDAVFPQQLRQVLIRMVRGRFGRFVDFSRQTLAGELEHRQIEAGWRGFVSDAVGLEAQRSSTIFENPQTRARSVAIQRMNLQFMEASTSLLRLHGWMQRLRQRRDADDELAATRAVAVLQRIEARYGPLLRLLSLDPSGEHTGEHARALAEGLHAYRLDAARESNEAARSLDPVAKVELDIAQDLLEEYARETQRYASSYAQLRAAPVDATAQLPIERYPRRGFVPHTDTLMDVIAGARAGLTLLLGASFWIATAWPSGLDMVILATVFAALYGITPNPIASLHSLWSGFLLAAVCGIFCYTLLLPRVDGFLELSLALLPFLAIGAYLLTRPSLAGIGSGYNILLINTLDITIQPKFDFNDLLNNVAASLGGVLLVVLMMAAFMPAGSRWFRRRMLGGLRRYIVTACIGPLAGQRFRFETATRDLLQRLLAWPGATAQTTAQSLRWASLVMDCGRDVLDLRQLLEMPATPSFVRERAELVLLALSRLFAVPGAGTHREVVDRLGEFEGELAARSRVPEVASLLAKTHLLRVQLEQAAEVLAHADTA